MLKSIWFRCGFLIDRIRFGFQRHCTTASPTGQFAAWFDVSWYNLQRTWQCIFRRLVQTLLCRLCLCFQKDENMLRMFLHFVCGKIQGDSSVIFLRRRHSVGWVISLLYTRVAARWTNVNKLNSIHCRWTCFIGHNTGNHAPFFANPDFLPDFWPFSFSKFQRVQ